MTASSATFDTIVQGATVELFHSLGVAVAPVKRARGESSDPADDELSGTIDFNGRGWAGSLILSTRKAVFELVHPSTERPFSGRDWILELTNQLLGRIRSRLQQFGVTVHPGLPAELTPELLKKQRLRHAGCLEYTFKTIRGPIVVLITGKIDPGVLKYSSGVNLASEGDIILF